MTAAAVLYAALCVVVLIHALGVLLKMTPRTNHVRRSAFVLSGFGAMVGLLEVANEVAPLTSMLVLLLSFLLLVSAGLRYGPRRPPGPPTVHSHRNDHATR